MRRFAVFLTIAVFLISFVVSANTASADWRWVTPKMQVKKVKARCDTYQCSKRARQLTKLKRRVKITRYNLRREREWVRWTHLYIPQCTWYGESGTGPEYARHRYTMPNQGGSGAYGKFQFMPSTYFSVAKYGDWSPLDQEIAARREYWRHGTSPWTACG